jgi:adenylate cyclase class 2
MAREIEIKLKLADPAGLQARLAAESGPPIAQFEENTLFDRTQGELRAAGCGLRLRRRFSADRTRELPARLTFKGPRAAGPLKDREEIESDVGDAAAFREILQRLGFQPVVIYEKRRAGYAVADCTIEVDELPRLGWFVEIEGPTEAAIRASQARLGLTDAPVEEATYVALAAREGQPEAGGVRALRF